MNVQTLISTAKELNEVLGLDPAINLKASEAVLKAKIREAAELLTPDDAVTEETTKVLQELGVWIDKDKTEEAEEIPEEKEDEEIKELSLAEEINAAENLKQLKDLVKITEELKFARNVLTKFSTTDGLKIFLLESLSKKEDANAKPTKEVSQKEKGEPGKPGIIASIVEMVEKSGKKGVTKAEILDELIKRFPDRSEDSMRNTINVQVPARVNKEKFPVKKLEGDRYCKA